MRIHITLLFLLRYFMNPLKTESYKIAETGVQLFLEMIFIGNRPIVIVCFSIASF